MKPVNIEVEPKLGYVRVECPQCKKQLRTNGAMFRCTCGELLVLPLLDQYNTLIASHNVLSKQHDALREAYNQLVVEVQRIAEQHNKLRRALGIGEDAGLDILSKKLETVTGTPTIIQIKDSVINKSFMDKE
jgi:hypothetical protein